MLATQRIASSSRVYRSLLKRCRNTQNRSVHLAHLPTLHNAKLEIFKQHAFEPSQPYLLPRGTFTKSLPAISSWFTNNPPREGNGVTPPAVQLNTSYLAPFSHTTVPLELTTTNTDGGTTFTRTETALSLFLTHISTSQSSGAPPAGDQNLRIYLAQCPLPTLPADLIASSLPAPIYVTGAGKGDIYDSSIWLGMAPTHTPLHRDPNPNLFVQLAGRKIVRVFEPAVGRELFAQATAGSGGGVRLGEEMMAGEGRAALDAVVWENVKVAPKQEQHAENRVVGYEAVLDAGDGMFIPKGWWHSIKGVGDGIVGSVNWWFR